MFSEEMICSLNDLELEVYKYVVRNADKVCYMRIREFADAAHVSTSTILRFCKKAGCDAGQGRCVGGHRLFEKDLLGGV